MSWTLRRLCAGGGAGIGGGGGIPPGTMVTHDARAAAYGDGIVTLEDGRVVSDESAPTAVTT